MKIKLRLLYQAQALLEQGSFSRAAEKLNLSQPALSRGIKELEDQVGLQVFQRKRSGLELSDFGRMFMQHAAELILAAEDLEREVALARGLETSQVSIGAGPYVMASLMPICTPDFIAAHPAVRLKILTDSPSVVGRLVRTRIIDLGIAEASTLESYDDLEVVTRLSPLQGYLMVRKGHLLTSRAQPRIVDVLEYPFAQVITLPPRVLKPVLAARRLPHARSRVESRPFPAIECPTLDLAVQIVTNSDAFMFAALGMVRAEIEQGRMVPVLCEPWMHSNWCVVKLRKRSMSPAMTAFVKKVEQAHEKVVRDEEELRALWYRPADSMPNPAKPRRRKPATR
jgi:DNA-binding transcriptional LysR family regulator